jgi:hypothetical protein
MSNEAYLIVSYFAVGVVCLGLGLAAYLWLRRPLQRVADSLPLKNWSRIIRRDFPLSTILFVLSGCLSVNYYGCEQKKYNKILNNRSYATKKNAEQISEALKGTIWAVGLWSVILAAALRALPRAVQRSSTICDRATRRP